MIRLSTLDRRLGLAVIMSSALFSSGCSTVMEARRPDPVDLHKYALGQRRIDVISRLGTPTGTVQDGANSCDVYKLYTNGIGRAGKGAVILGEAAADFFTLGLAEVVTTPGEAMTKNKLHTVLACYSPDGTLASLTDEGKSVMAMPVASASPELQQIDARPNGAPVR